MSVCKIERMEESAWSTEHRSFKVSNSWPTAQPSKTWNDKIRSSVRKKKAKSART